MASRRSGRRGKGGKGFVMAIGSALLIGAGAGGYLYFSGDSTAEASAKLADVVPDVTSILKPREDRAEKPAADANAATLAQLGQTIAECEATLALTDKALEDGLRASYAKLCPLLEGPMPRAERDRAIEVFHKITKELFLNSTHNEFNENYAVKSGDSFAVIASRAGISLNLLYDLNNKQRGARDIHPGDNLKLPKGKPNLIVRKADFTASLYFGDKLVRQYIIAHGKGDNTPEGQTSISSKIVDPEKGSQGSRDPVNEMRLRWLGMEPYVDTRPGKPAEKRRGFGFHGTIYPDSIGKMESLGCIRMKDADVIELYDIVREGNKVEVKA